MKWFGMILLISFGLILSGCGGSGNSPMTANINGNWTAALTNTDGTPAFAFTTTFTQMGVNGLNLTHFTFTTTSPCFVSGETQTGTIALSGDFNGNVTGLFGLTIQSGSPGGNTLTLSGNVKNNVITGTWTLTGISSGCTGAGNFTISRS